MGITRNGRADFFFDFLICNVKSYTLSTERKKIRGTPIWRPRQNRTKRVQIGPKGRSRAPDGSPIRKNKNMLFIIFVMVRISTTFRPRVSPVVFSDIVKLPGSKLVAMATTLGSQQIDLCRSNFTHVYTTAIVTSYFIIESAHKCSFSTIGGI